MPLLKKLNKNLPDRIRGLVGMLVIFKDGVAKVDRATANHFGQVPGFEIEEIPGEQDEPAVTETAAPEAQTETIKPPEDKQEAPTESTEQGTITVESFESLHWMKQKSMIEKGEVPMDILMFVAENGVTQKVRDAANKKLGR
jgi:hypothetical protein